ncbi:hypothetical protein SteCoe_34885 [Stentor coeruleus]|uniref:Macro domain-containing protein n=1 Tax=Stentor coeruleus TaxID=5963 RepID=A0A1R2ATX2_9CILI|nr:hypothetical protein SteCoe_34885 [Stentor coeruleus]
MNSDINQIRALGEYKDSYILVKKGSSLDEYPINYTLRDPNGKFSLFSAIDSKMRIGGLTGEICNIYGENAFLQSLRKKRCNLGDIIPLLPSNQDNPLRHYTLLVLNRSGKDVDDHEKIFLKNTIIKALEDANRQGMQAVVIPGICCKTNSFPLSEAADLHFEAVEEFIENNDNRVLRLFVFCLYQDDEIGAFLSTASYKFKKYTLHWKT